MTVKWMEANFGMQETEITQLLDSFRNLNMYLVNNLFKNLFIYLFLERGEGKKRGKHQCVVASRAPPTGDLAHNPGMCPDYESNQWPFGLQASTQSTEPHQPGLNAVIKNQLWENLPISSQFFKVTHLQQKSETELLQVWALSDCDMPVFHYSYRKKNEVGKLPKMEK